MMAPPFHPGGGQRERPGASFGTRDENGQCPIWIAGNPSPVSNQRAGNLPSTFGCMNARGVSEHHMKWNLLSPFPRAAWYVESALLDSGAVQHSEEEEEALDWLVIILHFLVVVEVVKPLEPAHSDLRGATSMIVMHLS